MSANDKSKKSTKNTRGRKDEKPTSDGENRNTSFDYIDEENQENFNLMSCCMCKGELKESDFDKENIENKSSNKIQKAKDSINEYEKINKKLSFLAELIENKFDSKDKTKSKDKAMKSQSAKVSKENDFVFYPAFITPNFILSLDKKDLFLSNFERKSLSDFTETDIKKSDNEIKEKNGNDLIDIDDILEMENFDFRSKMNTNRAGVREEVKTQTKSGFDENPFRKNFAMQFSNDKKRFKFENKLVKDLSSFSSLLQSEIGQSNSDKSEDNFSEDLVDINKKAFILKKKIHSNNEEKKKTISNNIRMNSTQEEKMPIDESKIDIVETPNEETQNAEKGLKDNLEMKAFSLRKLRLFYEKLTKFNEEINSNSFDKQMREDLIFNKYFLTNKLLDFHPLKNLINETYKDIPYNHLKVKMRDNSLFKLNRVNTGINTQAFINQINRHSGTVITTLNELLNSLRNTTNLTHRNADDDHSMDIDHEDLIEDEFFENEEEYENEHDEHMEEEDEYETVEENSEEGSNPSEEHLQ